LLQKTRWHKTTWIMVQIMGGENCTCPDQPCPICYLHYSKEQATKLFMDANFTQHEGEQIMKENARLEGEND